MRDVVIVQETMPHYRVDLLDRVRARAADSGIAIDVVHGTATGRRGERLGATALEGATVVRNRYVALPGTSRSLIWQPTLRRCLRADLVIVEQANRMLLNPVLLACRKVRGPKVAFWGHGRDHQGNADSWRAWLKRRMLTAPDWWFAYTEGVAQYLEANGVDPAVVTVVGNTIDVDELRDAVERAGPGTRGRLTCGYLGGFYPQKRLDFLFAAAEEIHRSLPDFELLVAGGGEQQHLVDQFCGAHPWARSVGHVGGDERASFLASVRLLLNPGLVGLVALDSFAAGAPLVTTLDAQHSPEIEYLRDGVNGCILGPGTSPASFAAAVVDLLRDEQAIGRLADGARHSGGAYGLDAAVDRFVHGIDLVTR